jgi:hypothetical protein
MGPLYKYEASDKYEYTDSDELGDHWEHYEYTRDLDLKYQQVDIRSNVKECLDPDNKAACSSMGMNMTFKYDDPLLGLDKVGGVLRIATIMVILAIIFSIVIIVLAPLSGFFHKINPSVVGIVAIIEIVLLIVGVGYFAARLPAGYKADLNDMGLDCPSGASPCESFEGYRTQGQPTDTLHHYTMFKHEERWGPENLWYMTFVSAGLSAVSVFVLFFAPRAPLKSKDKPSPQARSTPTRDDRQDRRPYTSEQDRYGPPQPSYEAGQHDGYYDQDYRVRCPRCGTEHEYEYCPNCGEPPDNY